LLGTLTLDPPRRLGRAGHLAPSSLRSFLRERWRRIGAFVGAAGCLVIAVQAINYLIALALERRFDAAPGQIDQAMGVIVLVTTIGCLPVAGLLDRALARRLGRATRPMIMGVCTLISAPVVVLLATTGALDHAFVIVAMALFATSTANALVPTMLQDLAPPALRARSFAIWSFVVSVFGASGPLLAGTLSDWVFNGHLLNAITLTALPALTVSAICATRLFFLTYREHGVAAGQPA